MAVFNSRDYYIFNRQIIIISSLLTQTHFWLSRLGWNTSAFAGHSYIKGSDGVAKDNVDEKRILYFPTNLAILYLFLFGKTEYGTRRKLRNISLKNYPSWSMSSRKRRIWSFHVAVLQRTAKKCTKNYNARTHSHCSPYRIVIAQKKMF